MSTFFTNFLLSSLFMRRLSLKALTDARLMSQIGQSPNFGRIQFFKAD